MKPASIRFRVTAIAVVAVATVLAVVAFGVVLYQRSQLTAALDSTLRQRADDIAALVAAAETLPTELGASQQEGFAQLIDGAGEVIAASPNLGRGDQLAIEYTVGDPETLRTMTGLPVDDDAFRVISRTVATRSGPAALHVGTTYDVVGESTDALTTSLAVSIPVAVILLAGLVWVLVGTTLQPVERIRLEVAAIGAHDLDRRVSQPATGDEIALLAATMNQMLGRIEESVTKQQRFVADASHELRSPLTRMRSEIEVSLRDKAPVASSQLESLLAEVVGLQDLVADLLHLARSDAGSHSMSMELVDLDDLVLAEAGPLQLDGRVTVDMKGVSAARVEGDKGQLTRAIRNLLDNAARHAAGIVTITLCEEADTAVLTVGDDGPGFAPDQVQLIFERFARLDDSRSRASGGSGLGLSIARDIVHRHSGTIDVDLAGGPGARFVVRLPRA